MALQDNDRPKNRRKALLGAACLGLITTFSVWTAVDAQEATLAPLTFSADQVSRGQSTFDRNCSACHGEDLRGLDDGPPLVGDAFARWFEGSVGELFAYVSSAMPADNPAALSTAQYVNLVAFLLSANGFSAGEEPLPEDTALLDAMGFTQP